MNMIAAIVAPSAPVVTGNPLSSRAMLARLTVTGWSARKLDRKATDKVHADTGAAHDAGRYNKALVAGAALAGIVTASNAARAFHYSRTLPWLDDGARILPSAGYAEYSEGMHKIRLDYEAAVAAFVSAYPSYVEDAKARLNGLFSAADYPDAREIEAKFSFGVRMMPMPDAGDFRADMPADAAAQIRAEIEAASREALHTAMRDAWERVVETVGKMAEKLTAYRPADAVTKAEGIFRDSLVENIRDLCAVLPSFNLTNDPVLASIADRMQRLTEHNATALRENAALREETAAAAQSILDDVSAYLA